LESYGEGVVRRWVSKQLICPRCGDVVADVEYRPWGGSLTITSTEGHQITPSGWAIQLRLAEQDVASAAAEDLQEARARLEFLGRHIGELIYDIRCRRGHSTLRTGPQITRAVRRAKGHWVSLSDS
jgi:hypothetical protein